MNRINWLKYYFGYLKGMLTLWGFFGKGTSLVTTLTPELMNDQRALRLWIITQADNFLSLVGKTENKIDDLVVEWVKKIALNEKAFAAIYNLLLLAYGLIPQETTGKDEPVFGVGEMLESYCDAVNEMTSDEAPESAMTIITAIGLMIQVIQIVRWLKDQRASR